MKLRRGRYRVVKHVLGKDEWSTVSGPDYRIVAKEQRLRDNEEVIESGLMYKDARRLIRGLKSIEEVMQS